MRNVFRIIITSIAIMSLAVSLAACSTKNSGIDEVKRATPIEEEAADYSISQDEKNLEQLDGEWAITVSEEFVAESTLSVELDSNGDIVIVLTNMQKLSSDSRTGIDNYAQTKVAVLPTDEKEVIDIIESIAQLSRASNSHSEDDWFYGSSVFLSSTVYYSETTSSGLKYIGIDKTTISCSVNSGTSISSMSLLMGQIGFLLGGGYSDKQKTTFNATTTRTFNAPSSWIMVHKNDNTASVGAHLTATAVRQGGQSTFTLYHAIVGSV